MAISIKLDDELEHRVRRLAQQRQLSAHSLMREAIEQYVAREAARENLGEEAGASWTAFQATGRHLTGEEVRAWLDTWGTESETSMPECHE